MNNGSIGQENPNLESMLNSGAKQDSGYGTSHIDIEDKGALTSGPSDSNEPPISNVKTFDSYIGTKIVQAEEMVEWEFLRLHKGMSKSDIDKRETQGDGYLVIYEDGYKSWSPKETFERAYRKITKAEKKLI